MRPSLFCDFANTRRLDPRFAFSRASTGYAYNRSGLLVPYANNVPRFDHDPETGESLGLLLEEARTNIETYSEGFDQTGWVESGLLGWGSGSTADAAASPDGNTTADLITENTATTNHQTSRSVTYSTTTLYALSCFVKQAVGTRNFLLGHSLSANGYSTAVFDMANRIVGAVNAGGTYPWTDYWSRFERLPNAWNRCAIVAKSPGTAGAGSGLHRLLDGTTSIYAGDGASGQYLFGSQLEAGAFPTSYIPELAGSTATRSADICSAPTTDWYNQREGTFIVRFRMPTGANDATRRMIAITDGTDTNRLTVDMGTDKRLTLYSTNGATNLTTANTYTSDAFNTVVIRIKDGEFGVCLNGGAVAENAAHVKPTQTLTTLLLGTLHTGTLQPCGTIARLAYYPYALSNAAMQALSS